MAVSVIDPFGASADPEMPTLALALNRVEARRRIASRLRLRLAGENGEVLLRAIRVVGYKPRRRCVVEYEILVERPDLPAETVTLIGKVRRGRLGNAGYRLLVELWDAGFRSDSRDGISVPEPIGTVSKFRMWLQRKVSGQLATDLLVAPGGAALGRRIATAVHKVHGCGVPARRRHRMADELRVLRDCLAAVAQEHPAWAGRIEGLLEASTRLASALPEVPAKPIHRDFYADQVIVDDDRIHLIDFDEYCEGDPALDVGNFIGALTEQGLRTLGSPDALVDVEQAMEERFVELAGEARRPAVRAYATLTLVRQVCVSRRIPERRPFTESLLTLCEDRLAPWHRSERSGGRAALQPEAPPSTGTRPDGAADAAAGQRRS